VKIERKMAIQGHVFWGQWKGDKGLNKKLSYRLETGRQQRMSL